MSTKDFIKKSVLENFTQYSTPKLWVALLAALLMGVVIYLVYRRFYTGVVFSRSFAVTLVGMSVLTCMVTLAISTNVVISLGMVGALSIVRFRTAVKDPMDLLYLFWSITTGITTGAGMYLLALTAAVVMILMLLLFYHWQERGRVYIAVIHYTGQRGGMTSSVPSAETSMSSSLRQCAAIRLRWLPRCSARTRSLNFQTACAPYPALPM